MAETQNPRTDREQKFGDLGVGDARGGMKGGSRQTVRRGVDTIKEKRMKVCGIERGTPQAHTRA